MREKYSSNGCFQKWADKSQDRLMEIMTAYKFTSSKLMFIELMYKEID